MSEVRSEKIQLGAYSEIKLPPPMNVVVDFFGGVLKLLFKGLAGYSSVVSGKASDYKK